MYVYWHGVTGKKLCHICLYYYTNSVPTQGDFSLYFLPYSDLDKFVSPFCLTGTIFKTCQCQLNKIKRICKYELKFGTLNNEKCNVPNTNNFNSYWSSCLSLALIEAKFVDFSYMLQSNCSPVSYFIPSFFSRFKSYLICISIWMIETSLGDHRFNFSKQLKRYCIKYWNRTTKKWKHFHRKQIYWSTVYIFSLGIYFLNLTDNSWNISSETYISLLFF